MHTMYSFRRVASLLVIVALLVGCDGFETGTPPNEDQTENPTTVQFATDAQGVVPADSIVTVDVTLSNPDGAAVSVEVLFAEPASSASSDELGELAEVRSLRFPEGTSETATRSFEVDVSGVDISEGPKEVLFALQNLQTEGQATIGDRRQFALNIGFPPLADLREDGVGTSGLFSAIVTEVSGDDARVQDGDAAIAITRRSDFTDAVEQGDEVSITGTVSEFAQQLQIDTDDLSSFEVLSSGNELPDPIELTLADAADNFDEYENERVRVEEITIDPDGDDTFQAGGSAGNYTVTDNEGNELIIRIPGDSFYAGKPIPEGPITFEGVLGRFFGDIQLRAQYEENIITSDG